MAQSPMLHQLKSNFSDYDTLNCGHIDTSQLADDAAEEFDIYEDRYELIVSQRLLQLASEIAELYEVCQTIPNLS